MFLWFNQQGSKGWNTKTALLLLGKEIDAKAISQSRTGKSQEQFLFSKQETLHSFKSHYSVVAFCFHSERTFFLSMLLLLSLPIPTILWFWDSVNFTAFVERDSEIIDCKSSHNKVKCKSNAYSVGNSKQDYYQNTPPASTKLCRVLFITPRGLFTPSNLDISLRYDSEDQHYIPYRVNRERYRHFPGTG